MGREGHEAIQAEFGVYDDAALNAYVEGVGRKLAAVSHLPNLEWHFTTLDDPVVNAFALPGGYTYISRGILAHLNSEAQLAGVMGHEIGHVTARHSAQRMTQQQLAGLGLGVATIFSKTFSRYSDAAQQGLGLLFLKYGRDDENQSDELGVQYSVNAGYDPRAIPYTYQMLARVTEGAGERLPSYLSTHPDPGDRQQRTTQLAEAAIAGKTGLELGIEPYLQHIDGIVYGNDPQDGYFEGNHYFHPNLGFEIQFPEGWDASDKKTAVVAVAPEQRAMMQLTLAQESQGASPASYVQSLQQSGKVSEAQGRTETINGMPAWVGRLAVPGDGGQPMVLAAAFIQAQARASEDRAAGPVLFQILGRTGQEGDADEKAILASARSLNKVTDPSVLNAKPSRVKVVTLDKGGSFGVIVPNLGPQAISLEETAILNNREVTDVLEPGNRVKIVVRGK
jgi:predicted Zn-dependent protease